jgi:ribosomal protein S8
MALSYQKYNFEVPSSDINLKIIKMLYKEGYILTFLEKSFSVEIFLARDPKRKIFSKLDLKSIPKNRIYLNFEQLIKYHRHESSYMLLSTSKGILFGHNAIKRHLGGEFLFKIII